MFISFTRINNSKINDYKEHPIKLKKIKQVNVWYVKKYFVFGILGFRACDMNVSTDVLDFALKSFRSSKFLT